MSLILGWIYFAISQIVSGIFTLLGFVILLPFCITNAWEPSPTPSINDGRIIDEWTWKPLNYIYGNPEDGVSGQKALIWTSGTTRGEYLPKASAWWRAYSWSALRNSTGGLKYIFQWRGSNPPYASGAFDAFDYHWTWGLGWKLENKKYLLPVMSIPKRQYKL